MFSQRKNNCISGKLQLLLEKYCTAQANLSCKSNQNKCVASCAEMPNSGYETTLSSEAKSGRWVYQVQHSPGKPCCFATTFHCLLRDLPTYSIFGPRPCCHHVSALECYIVLLLLCTRGETNVLLFFPHTFTYTFHLFGLGFPSIPNTELSYT